jgi:hypothetical protein
LRQFACLRESETRFSIEISAFGVLRQKVIKLSERKRGMTRREALTSSRL